MVYSKELNDEICRLCDTQSLSNEDIKKRQIICERILNYLRPFYPECEIHIYGSTLNSYGTKQSDLDLLFVPYPGYKYENVDKVKPKVIDLSCPSVNEVKNGSFPKEALINMDICNQLNFIRKVLKKNGIHPAIVIPARCPILHFNINYVNMPCDMSYGSRLVLYNTKLLCFYNSIDYRVRLLVMTVRHWAKCLHFVQPGVLSSYAVTLLVIFFLQTTNPPIVPSVEKLKDLSESSECVDNWEVAFTTDIHKIDVSKNSKFAGELLKEFFTFYWKFDFVRNVVCPFIGRIIPIKELLDTNDERLKDFEITSVCIQDPFILSLNVGRTLKSREYCVFKHALFVAAELLNNEKNSFELLFDENEYLKRCTEIFDLSFPEEVFTFRYNLTYDFTTRFQDQTNLKEIWVKNVIQSLLDFFRYALLIECEVIDKSGSLNENRVTEKYVKSEHNFELLMSIQCAVYHRTYVGRSKMTEIPEVACDSDQFSNEVIRNEFIISNYLIQQNELLSSPEPFFWFYCDCYINRFDELASILIVLSPLTKCKEIKAFFNFLVPYIDKKLTQILMVKTESIA